MDSDIHHELIKVGKLTQDIGRLIASSKTDVEKLQVLSRALDQVNETVKIHRQIQIMRYR